jgi:cytochrome c
MQRGDGLRLGGTELLERRSRCFAMEQSLIKRRGRDIFAACVVALATIVPPASAQEAASGDEGRLLFNNHCRTCHSLNEGDNRLGPHLHGVVGRKAGSVANFSYSSSLKDSGLTFDEATLDRFIASPDQVTPGNGMRPYAGMSSADERAKLVEFLRSSK